MGSTRTTWHPVVERFRDRRFLLSDYSIEHAPLLEESASGRRVRVSGTTKTYARSERTKAQEDFVSAVAKAKGVDVVIELAPNRETMLEGLNNKSSTHYGRIPDLDGTAVFHLTQTPEVPRAPMTRLVWEFQSTVVPDLSALMYLSLDHGMGIRASLTYRVMHPTRLQDHAYGVGYAAYAGKWVFDQEHAFRDPIDGLHWGHRQFELERHAVMAFAAMARQINAVDTIDIPFFGDGSSMPTAQMPFKFVRSNVSAALLEDLAQYAEHEHVIKRVRENYTQLREDLRLLGFPVTEPHNDSFLQLVEEGNVSSLTCHMIPQTEEEEDNYPFLRDRTKITKDLGHTISADLRTGTLIVNCVQKDGESSGAADKWEFERFQAELKGELPAFLGFAKQAHNSRVKRRFDRVVERRGGSA